MGQMFWLFAFSQTELVEVVMWQLRYAQEDMG